MARTTLSSRLRARLTAALLVVLLPFTTSSVRAHGRTSVASGGAVGHPFADELTRESVRRALAEHGNDTYIGEMLTERDSSLARWHDRGGDPLLVWVQPASDVAGWDEAYLEDVHSAFADWNVLELPVRFTFTTDSAAANVHVTFVDHFEEPISGRTKWARDDDWWITDADIALAVYHRGGPMLDDEAMHAMALHEIGHLLGLDHTADPTSIMATRVRVRALSPADRATARLLYTLPPGGVR
ncbi:hypothetical protein BH09GEM1_BH09GEM1_36680 [soil metagenome]